MFKVYLSHGYIYATNEMVINDIRNDKLINSPNQHRYTHLCNLDKTLDGCQ